MVFVPKRTLITFNNLEIHGIFFKSVDNYILIPNSYKDIRKYISEQICSVRKWYRKREFDTFNTRITNFSVGCNAWLGFGGR